MYYTATCSFNAFIRDTTLSFKRSQKPCTPKRYRSLNGSPTRAFRGRLYRIPLKGCFKDSFQEPCKKPSEES